MTCERESFLVCGIESEALGLTLSFQCMESVNRLFFLVLDFDLNRMQDGDLMT